MQETLLAFYRFSGEKAQKKNRKFENSRQMLSFQRPAGGTIVSAFRFWQKDQKRGCLP